MRVYFHVRDQAFVTDERGTLSHNNQSAISRAYVDDEKNLPVSIAFSTDRRVDKILETVGFIPLEARV